MLCKCNERVCGVVWGIFFFLACGLEGCSAVEQPNAYKRDYMGMSRRDVMIEWSKSWMSEPAAEGMPWLQIDLGYPSEDKCRTLERSVIVRLADFPGGKTRWLPLPQSVDECLGKSPYVFDASKWSCFDRTLQDCWPFDFKSPRERLSVWFDDEGVVTNQCVESYMIYY